jgi:nucleotide-binding universal stress UspA family protein
MTTSEQAALLAKHRAIEDDGTPGAALYLGYCYTCERPFPCDVHKMAELKDAEIADLRDSHRATKGLAATFQQQRDDLQAEIERLKGALDEARMEAAMDDFAQHTTPGGTWVMESDWRDDR